MKTLRNTFLIGLSGVLLCACENGPSPASGNRPPTKSANRKYFDLESYFQQEISRLDSLQPEVAKTVSNNREEESRTLKQLDWETELALFSNSGINKPSWRDSYAIDSSAGRLNYQSTDPDLRVRNITINRSPRGKITAIIIQREVTNYLYNSTETLSYYPDSLYEIDRRQKVKILGEDHFRIRGEFHL